MPEMMTVASSNIAAIGYDAVAAVLFVRFHRGTVYRYHGVSIEVFRAFLAAGSKGRFFAHFIKNRYAYARAA